MRSNTGAETPSEEATTAAGLDVAETDDYLYSLLLPRVASMWKYLDGAEALSPHVLLWIQALVQGTTLWVSSGQTPATSALGLKTIETTRRIQASRATIAKWIVLSVVLPTLHHQLRFWYENSTSSTDMQEDTMAQLARERKQKLVRFLVEFVDRTVPALRLYALLAWWMGKRNSAPNLAMTLAGLSVISTRPPQRLHVSFAHRRWLYEELVRTMQMVAPFSSWSDFSSYYNSLLRPVKYCWERLLLRQRHRTSNVSRCPMCRSDPMTIPYITNCGHVYCYSCIWNATSNNERFPCRVCHQIVSNIGPYLVNGG